MVIVTRSATPKLGQAQASLEFATKVAKYINEKFNTSYRVYTQGPGYRPVGTILWVGSFESIAVWEKMSAELDKDEGYINLLHEVDKLFVSGTTMDSILLGPH